MESFDAALHPHRRRNPLTGDWQLVSPQRGLRPWQGAVEARSEAERPSYATDCYLCPGNVRSSGERNPDYASTFVFDNDFPALLPTSPAFASADPLFATAVERGRCRVICYSPRHDLSLAELDDNAIAAVVNTWAHESTTIGRAFPWVQIFENKGEQMGCSMPHPHGQIWAQSSAPTLVARESTQQANYLAAESSNLLLDYAQRESTLGERVIAQNDDWLAVVPYWAAWPFEVLLLPLAPAQRISALDTARRWTLARLLREIAARYDNLFECPFPYSMGWHQAPEDGEDHPEWQLHAHFYPPLLRSAEVRKFMVGYEMLAEAQRDITPEQAAMRLRAVSSMHYRSGRASPASPPSSDRSS
ncbi:MAG: UDP-glucose--hexose-1-phosphate uridylyltransferase [Pseudomonadota bacterium]